MTLNPGRQLRQLSPKMGIHHLIVGTWTPPGAIFTFAFDDEALTLKLVKRTEIAQDEPISWMTFDASLEVKPQKDYILIRSFLYNSMRKRPSTELP